MKTTSAAVVTALAMIWITSACDGPRTVSDSGPIRVDSGPVTLDDAGAMTDAGTLRDAGTLMDGGTMTDGGADAAIAPDSAVPPVDGGPVVVCGDGVVSGAELCDPAIASGSPGACPASCNDGLACTSDVLAGTAGACDARCTTTPVTACAGGDGCCPSACTAATDADCSTCAPRACATGECGTVDDGCGGPLDCGTCAVGGACDVDADCATGVCITEISSGWPGGYCSLACAIDADCGAGSHCAFNDEDGAGACVANCATSADCRTPGYSCHDTDRDAPSTSECAPTGAGAGAIGDPCTTTAQCAGGDVAFCVVEAQGWQGGYCTRTCDDDTDCVGATHCGEQGICVVDCAGPTCRTPGYACHDYDADPAGRTECAPSATGARPTGAACRATFECAGGVDGFCIADTDWIDGYCTVVDCVTDSDCTSTAGGHCTAIGTRNLCTSNCTTDADCRGAGYVCTDLDADGSRECWAGATGTGAVGSPCELIWQCAGGADGGCFVEDDGIFRSGYCTVRCGVGASACPSGSHCSIDPGAPTATGLCVDNCTSDLDCRADGYRCSDTADIDTATECWPAATGTRPVGAACTGWWECAGEELGFCIAEQDDGSWNGGYCSRYCDAAACPSGSSCVTVSADGDRACLDDCTGTGMGDCRPTYTCGAAGAPSNVCF